MRRVALIIPVNRKGQILLQHRTADAPIKPNHWAFFGGHIEPGETPAEAAKREFREELQIELKDAVFFEYYIFDEEWGRVEKFFFRTLLDEDPIALKEQQLEGDDLGYFNYEDLKDLRISVNDRRVLETLFWHKPRA